MNDSPQSARIYSLDKVEKDFTNKIPECSINNIIELVQWLSGDLKNYLLNMEIHPLAAEGFLQLMFDIIRERVVEFIDTRYKLLEQISNNIKGKIKEEHIDIEAVISLLKELHRKNEQIQKEIAILMYAYRIAVNDIGNTIIIKIDKYNLKNKNKYINRLIENLEKALTCSLPEIIRLVLMIYSNI